MCKGSRVMHLDEARPIEKFDLYGQSHVEETPTLISDSLVHFEKEVRMLPAEVVTCLRQAEEKCPDQLTDAFKLMFLRCERFNATLAAKRYAFYWEKRVEFCGPELAFLPMTQRGIWKHDEKTLNTSGFCLFDEIKEPMGRAVAGFFPTRLINEHKHSNEALVRYVWYIAHAALESETAQRHGIVIFVSLGPLKFGQSNHAFEKMMIDSIQGALPMRMSAIHLVRPPSFFRLVWPIIRMFMSARTRKRVIFHFGSTEKLLKNFQVYGFTKDNLPVEFGGDIEHDHKAWLKQRREIGK